MSLGAWEIGLPLSAAAVLDGELAMRLPSRLREW